MEKKYFPIFIDLSGKKIVVIGGGVIATRRVKTLLEFVDDITVIAPQVTSELEQIEKEGKITWIPKAYMGKCIAYDVQPLNNKILCNEVHFPSESDICINEQAENEDCKCSIYRLQDADIVIAATNSPTVNHQVREDCRFLEKSSGKSILVSVADDKNLCDFYFPSIVQKENVVVGINSGGESPKITKELRKKIEESLDTSSIYSR